MRQHTIRSQLKENFVALVSLFVAVIALLYTAWREEETEKNRNLRTAAFEVLKNLGELQAIVNQETVESDNKIIVTGWGHVALISDLSDDTAASAVSNGIDTSRDAVVKTIKSLK